MRDPRIDSRIQPHNDECPGGPVTEKPGRKAGDTRITCSGCWRWAFVDADGVVIPKPERTPVVRAKPTRKAVVRAVPRPTPLPEPEPVPVAPVGRFMLDCIHCDDTIHFHDRRPRQPLCFPCRRRIEAAKRQRQLRAAEIRDARRASSGEVTQ